MRFFKKEKRMGVDYAADGLGVQHKSLDFMTEPAFESAWGRASDAASHGWENVPDIRWRAHIAIWAARNGLNIEGDFVECGVYTGILSLSICHYLNLDRTFWLYDTWDGIPERNVADSERSAVDTLNGQLYKAHDVYESTQAAFSPFPAKMIRGMLPETLEQGPDKIAYLSMDLNGAKTERECIEIFWPKLSRGAVVLIDDYGWQTHRPQMLMWNEFAREKGHSIANLPTGQGLLIKT